MSCRALEANVLSLSLECMVRNVPCHYKPAHVPLRERRIQPRPGEQASWSIEDPVPLPETRQLHSSPLKVSTSWQKIVSGSLDPFDTMAIKMPLESKNLLQYFLKPTKDFKILPSDTDKYSIGSFLHNAGTLHNVILIAALHYVWKTGHLGPFEATFLYHKIESIRMINTWLNSDSHDRLLCLKHITTLCFTECCIGHIQIGEAHLQGLATYRDVRPSKNDDFNLATRVEIEFMDRFLILVYNVIGSHKSRLGDIKASTRKPEESSPSKSRSDDDLVLKWHTYHTHGLEMRLNALHMIPFFFTPIRRDELPRPIDVRSILAFLREVTDKVDIRSSTVGRESDRLVELWDHGPDQLLFSIVNTHFRSLRGDASLTEQDLLSSWCGFTVSMSLYLTSVLGVWNQGAPVESRLLYHFLGLLKEDLQATLVDLATDSPVYQALWIWKAFVGRLSLAQDPTATCCKRLKDLMLDFNQLVRRWVAITGTARWSEVETVLTTICWPVYFQHMGSAEKHWERTQTSK
uniref:WGS project CBMG000000000 data, contig CS5907-c003342 n=1 Tax=Fusarium acuminatum CS5907 TaxID=1318461 RepID=A0A090N553_9HYPO|nr:unnamed protein product [Fusarium acuminatum CS5907]